MTEAPALGAGIIGYGVMGRTHAAGYLAARAAGIPVVLRAVTGARDEVPGGAEALQDPKALLDRPDIHAVSICTPTDSHVELALLALERGKHVLLEKPVAIRSDDVARLARAAHDAGLVCLPAMCMRFWPGWPWLRQRILDRSFGALLEMHCERLAAQPAWGDGFYADHRRSGGALFDLHIHDVDFLRWCCGDPAAITAAGSATDLTATYPFGQVTATARGAWLPDPATPFTMRDRARFEGGAVRYDLAAPVPLQVLRDAVWVDVPLPVESAYDAEVHHFLELVRDRTVAPVATLDESLAVTRILEAEARSLASGGSVAPQRAAG